MIIDSNEAAHCPWLVKAFPNATIQRLDIGDIATDDMSTIIERKTFDDLYSSIIDKRYKDQIRTLIELPSFIVIVKKMSKWNKTQRNMKIIHGAINSIRYKYRIPVKVVENNIAFINEVKKIISKRKDIVDLDVVVRRRTNDPTLELICALPGINSIRAKKLRDNFISMDGLCHASIQEISDIDGFGQKTAETIYNTLRDIK